MSMPCGLLISCRTRDNKLRAHNIGIVRIRMPVLVNNFSSNVLNLSKIEMALTVVTEKHFTKGKRKN